VSRIVTRRQSRLSPFATLVEKDVDGGEGINTFHSLVVSDYVNVFAVTPDARVALVRQYRPAVDGDTLELPGGLREEEESPEACAVRELYEETGLRACEPPVAMPALRPEPGRLENTLWPFFVRTSAPDPEWRPEPGVSRLLLSGDELSDAIRSGRFAHAGHLGIVAQALVAGFWSC
jgi:hypothetical protein